jgi:succinyl-CoA synthetase beta subunit
MNTRRSNAAHYDIPVPIGRTATSSDEAADIARELGSSVVVRAQVLAGGRGKAGGVKVAKSPEEAREAATRILGMQIKGLTVYRVLVDPAANIEKEIYLGIVNDRSAAKPVLISSSEGGIEIEIVARENPKAIIREYIDPLLGLHHYQTMNVASGINLPREHWDAFSGIALNLWKCFVESDLRLRDQPPCHYQRTRTGCARREWSSTITPCPGILISLLSVIPPPKTKPKPARGKQASLTLS